MSHNTSDAQRLEQLWHGDFGRDYVKRNSTAGEGREAFWADILSLYPAQSVLEVGCNIGGNLGWIAERVPPRRVFGVDINEVALEHLRTTQPKVNALWSPARELPFRDASFDLVFTTGVLIHQAVQTLPLVMAEIVRCSKRYVLCGEYHAEQLTEVPYRGELGALWKQDYGRLYQELFPELRLLKSGFLAKENGGWDDVTFWLFEKGR